MYRAGFEAGLQADARHHLLEVRSLLLYLFTLASLQFCSLNRCLAITVHLCIPTLSAEQNKLK